MPPREGGGRIVEPRAAGRKTLVLAWAFPGSPVLPVPGYATVAPNVQRFRSASKSLHDGFWWLRAGIACSAAAFALDVVVGLVALTNQASASPGALTIFGFGLGGVSLLLQVIAIAAALDGEGSLSSPDPEAFPDLVRAPGSETPWFLFALLVALVGGAAGFFLAFPDSMVRLHPGPAAVPYGPTDRILASAAIWGATGGAASLMVALGVRDMLNPYLGDEAKSRWPLFFALVATASAVSVALTVYGIFELRGDNPAGLGAPLSIASLALLWVQASAAKANVAARPEPAPVWPPPLPAVPYPAFTFPPTPAVVGAPPPGAYPTPGAPPSGAAAPSPPPVCPQCGSPNILVAYPPLRQVRCNRCGRESAY